MATIVRARAAVSKPAATKAARPARASRVAAPAATTPMAASLRQAYMTAGVSAASLVAANPALADATGLEVDFSAWQGPALVVGVLLGGLLAIGVPLAAGTLNPVQMLTNYGLVEGKASNEREFDRRGNPLLHGTNEGHVWYDTGAYVNGKFIDFAGVKNVNSQEGIENVGNDPKIKKGKYIKEPTGKAQKM